MAEPNFFLVGAPKCGTTAMHEYLRGHPDIFLPEWKEPHFFGADLRPDGYRRDLAGYEALFADRAGESRAGESSTWYLYSRRAAAEIKQYAPDALIVAMVRNPADMLYSLYHQMTFNGDSLPPFAEAVDNDRRRYNAYMAGQDKRANRGLKLRTCFHTGVARYVEQLQRYFEAFGRERVRVIVFDDFKSDTAAAYRDTLEFLGVDPTFRPDFRVYNPNKQPRSRLARTLMRATPMWVRRSADAVVGERLRRRLTTSLKSLNTRPAPRRPMDPGVRRRLIERFDEDIDRLADLLGRDLSAWKR